MLPKNVDFSSKQKLALGFSLVETLIAAAIVGVSAFVLISYVRFSYRDLKKNTVNEELETIRHTLRTQFNCKTSLGVSSASTLPLTCANYSFIVPKTKSGKSLTDNTQKIGKFTLNTRCVGNKVLFGISRVGQDPITSVSWLTPAINNDVFLGISDFCSEYFDPSLSTCSGKYPLYYGFGRRGADCCRRVTASGLVGGATVTCDQDEYLMRGSGHCSNTPGNGIEAYMFANDNFRWDDASNSNIFLGKNSWFVNCNSAFPFPGPFNTYQDKESFAEAICCPIY